MISMKTGKALEKLKSKSGVKFEIESTVRGKRFLNNLAPWSQFFTASNFKMG